MTPPDLPARILSVLASAGEPMGRHDLHLAVNGGRKIGAFQDALNALHADGKITRRTVYLLTDPPTTEADVVALEVGRGA